MSPVRVRHSPYVPRRLLGGAVVNRDLAIELHVVEDGHLPRADDRHAPHLVRVEPRQVHMRDLPGREAEVAEDDVLDAFLEKRLAARPDLGRLLPEQQQDHRQVVDAEAAKRVLLRPDRAEVLPVAVDVEDVSEVAGVDDLLQLPYARVVEEQVTGHEHPLSRLGELDELLRLIRGQRHRLLDEDVLAGGERALRELDMSGHGCRDDDRFDLVVLEDILEAVGEPRRREAGLHAVRVARRPGRRSTRARRARRSYGRGSRPSVRARSVRSRPSQLPDLAAHVSVDSRCVAQVDDEAGAVRRDPRSRFHHAR